MELLQRMETTASTCGGTHIPHQQWGPSSSGGANLAGQSDFTICTEPRCLRREHAFLWHSTVPLQHLIIYPDIGATCRYQFTRLQDHLASHFRTASAEASYERPGAAEKQVPKLSSYKLKPRMRMHMPWQRASAVLVQSWPSVVCSASHLP